MKRLSFLVAGFLVVLASCAHKKGAEAHSCEACEKCDECENSSADKYLKDVGPLLSIGKLPATSYKHMSFAAQPTQEDLSAAKALGYEAIINIREASELDWDVAAHVKSLGMAYYNVPLLDKSGEIDVAAVMKLEKIHKDTHKQKQLIFCSSGNRAAAWMAAHLMVKHELSAAQALRVGRKLGITRADIEKKVENLEAKLRL